MSTISIHPIEYLRLHAHYEWGWTRVLKSLIKKVFDSSEQAAAIAVLLLTVVLFVISCIIVVQSAFLAASYDAAITEIVVAPLQSLPIGM